MKTEPETLTDEERAYVAEQYLSGPQLLRLYDAALARAEAAVQRAQWDLEWRIEAERATKAAESRLVEATGCIKETLAGLDRLRETFVALDDDPVDADLVSADIDDASCPLRVFLSATPAPAATAGKYWVATEQQAAQMLREFFCWQRPDEKSDDDHDRAQAAWAVLDAAPAATAEPENPEADERHAKLVSVADKLRASRILVERIEAAVDDMFAMPDEKLQYIRDLIRAAKEGA